MNELLIACGIVILVGLLIEWRLFKRDRKIVLALYALKEMIDQVHEDQIMLEEKYGEQDTRNT